MLSEFLGNLIWLSLRLIHLIDGNNNRYLSSLGVLNSLNSLRLNTIICGYN